MDYQLFQDFPALRFGQVEGDGLFVAAFVQKGAAAQVAVDVVLEHVAFAPKGRQFAERRAAGRFHHDDVGPQFAQVATAEHGADLEAAMAALQHPHLAQGLGFGHLVLGMEPALKNGGNFPGRFGADLGIIHFFEGGDRG